MEAIKPEDVENKNLTDLAVEFLNKSLINQNWHDQIFKVEDYNAILLTPVYKYSSVMGDVVKLFKLKGWDCKWNSAYDARGPHECFYVHKKHFMK